MNGGTECEQNSEGTETFPWVLLIWFSFSLVLCNSNLGKQWRRIISTSDWGRREKMAVKKKKKRHWCNHCKICLYYTEWAHLWAIWISLWENYGWSKIRWYVALLFLMWFYYASLSLLGSWSTSVLNYQVIWIMMNHFLEPETWPHRAPASRTDTQNLNWRGRCSFSMHKCCSDAWICLSCANVCFEGLCIHSMEAFLKKI